MPRTEVTGSQIKDASVSLTADVTGTLPVANGGTGSTTIALNNVVLGNGTGAVQTVAPGNSGNVLTSDGTTWSSALPAVTLNNAVTLQNKSFQDTTFGSSAGGQIFIYANAAAGNFRNLQYQTAGVSRWNVRATNDAETGSDVGSNFEIQSRTDAGGPKTVLVKLERGTGNITLGGNVTVNGTVSATAGTSAGNVVTIDGTQALTGKTLTAPTLTGTTVNAQNGIIESYNTADQSTNYEKVVYRWNSNVAEIASLFGGTGSARAVTIGVSSGAGNATVGRSLTIQNAVPFVSCTSGGSGNSSTASGGAHIRLGSTSSQFTASSLHQTVVSVAGNMGQSGTASYTGLLVDITETSTGSGTKHLINAQVGGSSKFLVDNAGAITSNGVAVPTISSTHTLTSKRITPRVTTTNAPGATPTVATDSYDQINFTGLATAITSMTTNLTGTPTDGQMLTLRFKDDGTGRAITWGASYTSAAATLPTTTVANKTHLVRFLYDSAASKWACVSADATGY